MSQNDRRNIALILLGTALGIAIAGLLTSTIGGSDILVIAIILVLNLASLAYANRFR